MEREREEGHVSTRLANSKFVGQVNGQVIQGDVAILPLKTAEQASGLETQAEFLCGCLDANFFFFGKAIFTLDSFRLDGE